MKYLQLERRTLLGSCKQKLFHYKVGTWKANILLVWTAIEMIT